jgi:hypothetical protein
MATVRLRQELAREEPWTSHFPQSQPSTEGRIWRPGYRVMTLQLLPHLIRGARLASLPLAGLPGHSRQPEQVQFSHPVVGSVPACPDDPKPPAVPEHPRDLRDGECRVEPVPCSRDKHPVNRRIRQRYRLAAPVEHADAFGPLRQHRAHPAVRLDGGDLRHASWSITWPTTWIGAPVAAASASACPMRAVICRGPAVPAAMNSIRAGGRGPSRPRRGPAVSAASSWSMSTPVTATPAVRSSSAVIASAGSGWRWPPSPRNRPWPSGPSSHTGRARPSSFLAQATVSEAERPVGPLRHGFVVRHKEDRGVLRMGERA